MRVSLLQYLWLKLRYPALSDFLSEGFGIAARAERSKDFWRKHLDLTIDFQRQAIGMLTPPPGSFLVLGAGRLLDLDQSSIARLGSQITLVDADPGAQSAWKPFLKEAASRGSSVKCVLQDLTGRLAMWTKATRLWLRKNPKSGPEDFSGFLKTLTGSRRVARRQLEPHEVVISLNILSQIPIYWRERLVGILRRLRPDFTTDNQELLPEIDLANGELCGLLQREHLADLKRLATRLLILVADQEFYFYESQQSQWQVESACFEFDTLGVMNRQVALRDSWLWHIAPQGIEQEEYGVIHKVSAYAFKIS
jgi:hypothetical protein